MNTQTTRTHLPARDLTIGAIVHLVDDPTIVDDLARVEHVLPYQDGDGKPWVALTFSPLYKGAPLQRKVAAGKPFRLATDDDLAAAHDRDLLARLQVDLASLQALLGGTAPRLSEFGRDVSFNVADGEVERLAAELSLPVKPFGGTENIVVAWTAPGDEDRGPRLQVRFWGRPAVQPEPEHLAGDVRAVLASAGLNLDEGTSEPVDDGCPACGRLHFPWCTPHGGTGYATQQAGE